MLRRKALLVLLAVPALPVVAADISGTWKLEADIANAHVNRTCVLKQAATKLTGTCKGQTNEVTLTGEINGKKFTWTYTTDYQGQTLTLEYKGTLESDTAMKGSIAAEGATGTFIAKKE